MKALVIARNDALKNLLAYHLKPLGFEVIYFSDPVKALEELERLEPEMILASAVDFPRHWKPALKMAREHHTREELIFVRGRDRPIALPRASPVLQLIQSARDEAHRFAVGYHRTARRQRTLRSALDEIPGVGNERRRRLLSRFGSVRGVRAASEADLAGVVGPALATRIRQHFDHPPTP
jgi:hypothetical protein